MIDGVAAAQWLLNYGSVTPSMCLYYVWQAYKAQGASTGMGAQSAYAAWLQSDGKRPGDRNPPPGAAVWWGRRTWDGNIDGDVVISLGGGRVAVTEPPGQDAVTGSCTLDERENEISREYLGWTSSIFDCPINVAAGKDAITASEEDDMYDDNKHREVLTASRPIKLYQMGTGVVAVGEGGGFWVIPSDAYLQLLVAWELAGPNLVARPIDQNELTALCNLLRTANPGGDGTPGQQVDTILKLSDDDAKRIAAQLSGTIAGDVVSQIGERLAPKA
ncbi:hypothetical protein [Microbacterium sp. 13-71-7]|jgi:hypothetical protein|uniref:hypothetical protein n=1 Tax=Microbacterium sp. 13-71-7 TaxID=1970399 RepID=UPI0025D4BC16|nr:hypothetical protein [Microbacterium sp. 13-71-7]